MQDSAQWARLLFAWGPFGLILFFSAVTLPILNSKLKEDPSSTTYKRLYISNWIAVFVLGILISGIWLYLNVKQRAVLQGSIQNLPANYTVSNDLSDEEIKLYTLKEYGDRNNGTIKYKWAVLSEHHLPDGQLIPIIIASPQDPNGRELKLRIKSDYYISGVVIRYRAAANKFVLVEGDKESDLEDNKIDTAKTRLPAKLQDPTAPVVYASEPLNTAAMTTRLESPDPIIRRDARKDLASFRSDALSYINSILANPQSSYLLRLGGVVALNEMPDNDADIIGDSLSVDSLVTVLRGIGSSDDTYRDEARTFVASKGTSQMERKLSQALQQPSNNKAWKTQLALSDMDLLYNLGLKETGKSHFDDAINSFQKGWNDRNFASENAKIYFAKALYGWALTLASQSERDLDSSGHRNPNLIKAAQDKFREFLVATQTKGGSAYPGAVQIAFAKKYLQNPTLSQ